MHKSSRSGTKVADGKETDTLAAASTHLPPLPNRAASSVTPSLVASAKVKTRGTVDKSKARERNLRYILAGSRSCCTLL